MFVRVMFAVVMVYAGGADNVQAHKDEADVFKSNIILFNPHKQMNFRPQIIVSLLLLPHFSLTSNNKSSFSVFIHALTCLGKYFSHQRSNQIKTAHHQDVSSKRTVLNQIYFP